MKHIATALVLLASPVAAQDADCMPYDVAASTLEEMFGETRRVTGMMGPDRVFLVFANDETGTWTAVTVQSNGIACLRASGQDFGITAPEPNL